MKIRFQTVLAFAALYFASIACGSERLDFSVRASPSTFTEVGETITFIYTADANSFFNYKKYWGVTDTVADSPPTCTSEGSSHFSCTATHMITEEDFALGYVTSYAVAKADVSASYGFWASPSVDIDKNITTVVYIENFTPSPTPITPTFTTTPNVVFTSTALQPGESIIIPTQNILILQPVLAGSVSACDTGLGFINFPLADPLPDLTGKELEVIFNGYKVNCTIAGSRNQVLACSLPPDTTFPLNVGTTVDSVQVDSFSFSGATCIKTVPTKERDPNDPNTPSPPVIPTPVDCIADPYNPAC